MTSPRWVRSVMPHAGALALGVDAGTPGPNVTETLTYVDEEEVDVDLHVCSN